MLRKAPKTKRNPEHRAHELRAWIESAQGKRRMKQAASAASRTRRELQETLRVPGELLRARVTV